MEKVFTIRRVSRKYHLLDEVGQLVDEYDTYAEAEKQATVIQKQDEESS